MHTIQHEKGLVARLFAAFPSHFNGAGPIRLASKVLVRAIETVLAWQDRANQRLLLQSMPDHALKDMGLTRLDVEREARKPFWLA